MTYKIIDAQSYLCGDVLTKLEAAIEAAIHDPSFSREIEALTKAMPNEVPIEEVDIRIGATWIPLSYYEEFVGEKFDELTKFYYSRATGTWDVQLLSSGKSIANTTQYGYTYQTCTSEGTVTDENIPAIAPSTENGLFTMALHFKAPSVSVKKSKDAPNQKDQIETGRAIAKQEELQELWSSWCKEGERGQVLSELYNRKLNRTVLPNWDGRGQHLREHLAATGISQEWRQKLRPYQLDAIWRMCVGGNTLVGLEVGLGKTNTAIAAVMLRKQYKTCKKAMIVVQKSTLSQFYATFKKMYPKAKVLCATPEDCSEGNRQRFLAKAAFWDWDAIILTHESFNKIPVRAETERTYIQKQLEVVEEELIRLYSMGESSKRKGKKRGNRIVKKLEEMRNKISDRISILTGAQDVGIYFEDIDPSILCIDEAQKYKNNFVATKLQVTGLNVSESNRAQDFDLKIAHMRNRHKDGFLWLMTGTPEPTNSMLGVYVFQRYLHPEELELRGLSHFDAWATNFGRIVSEAEFKADGSLRITDRFCEFVNLPELLQMWLKSCHIKRYDDVKDQAGFVRPNGHHKKVSCYLSDWQLNYMAYLQVRYEAVAKQNPYKFVARDADGYLLDEDKKRLHHPVTKEPLKDTDVAQSYGLEWAVKTDNMLWINTDSRKLMVAPQLLDSDVPVETGDKISQAVRRIHRWWRLTQEQKSTQLVFLDWGTPGGSSKFPIYDWLRSRLLEKGIPKEEIAFIQDYSDDKKKAELFDKVNAGEVRVLIGSTEPMGIGVNVQDKVKVVHLLDIPRRPDQYEQRLGRAIRFGNENKDVLVYQYLTRGQHGNFGANAYELQLLEKKVKVREDVLRGDPTVRRVVEDNNAIEMYMKLKAHSSGDERILRYVDSSAELDKAKARANLTLREVNRLSLGEKPGGIKYATKQIASFERQLEQCQPDIEFVKERVSDINDPEVFGCKVGQTEYFGMTLPKAKKIDPRLVNFVLSRGGSSWTPLLFSIYYRPVSVRNAQKMAEDHIKQWVANIQLEIRMKNTGNGEKHRFGEFGGMPIWGMIHVFDGKPTYTMWLQGQQLTYRFPYFTSELRLIREMQEAYASVLDSERTLSEQLVRSQSTLENLKEQLQHKREERERLQKLVSDLSNEKQQLAAVLNMSVEI